jgi:asparagine synthetase B (glutamine-hydrolysing)
MAGIAGVQGSNVNALETMLASLQHLGSHETWTSPIEHTTIGCCKLGIESGQQRQLNSQANGKFAILNGGFNATSRGLTDATLVLSLHERFGAQWLDRQDGDFPCAVLDSVGIFLARDSLGVKPLYHNYKDGEFYFASEAKALTDVTEEVEKFPHIAFQTKRPFGSGAGSTKLIGIITEKEITDEEFMKYRCTEDGLHLNSKEELLYYRIFKEEFKHPSPPQLVAVWDPFKPGF